MFAIEDYLKYCIDNKILFKIKWYKIMFMILVDENYEDEFIKKVKDKIFIKMNGEEILYISNYTSSKRPILLPKDSISINKDFINIVYEDIETTIGRLIFNYLIFEYALNAKVKYINNKIPLPKIIDEMKLTNDINEKDSITIDEYITFVEIVKFIRTFNEIYGISSTFKSITKPKGVEEFKKKLLKKYEANHGKDFLTNKALAVEFDNELSEYEKDYIKDDESYGKLVTGKVMGARKKLYSSYGLGMDFNPTPKATYIVDSLYDGYGTERKKLSVLFNDARLGAYYRGAETQKAGASTKESLRATNDKEIRDLDCGTKLSEPVFITKNNYMDYIDRFIFQNNETVLLDKNNISKYIDKKVDMRIPRYCKLVKHYCKYCTDNSLAKRKNIISIMINDVGGIMLNESMSKSHNTSSSAVEIRMEDLIS